MGFKKVLVMLPKISLVVAALQIATAAGGSLQLMPTETAHHKFVGDSFFVSCDAQGQRVERLLWTGPDNTQISTYTGRVHVEEAPDASLSSRGLILMLEKITVSDNGSYSCSARVDGRELTEAFLLNVNRKTSFAGTAPEQSIEEGRDSEILCEADGSPKPKVKWRKDGNSISFDDARYRPSVGPPYTLTVVNVTLEDAGVYTCNSVQVSSHVSNFDDFNINVTVHHAPLMSPVIDGRNYGYIGGTVNLSCTATAVPSANFTWARDGKVIRPMLSASEAVDPRWPYNVDSIGRVDGLGLNTHRFSDRTFINLHNTDDGKTTDGSSEDEGDPRYEVLYENNTSYLQINITDASLFGDYECRATNSLGTVERALVLQEGLRPPVPSVTTKKVGTRQITLDLSVVDEPAHEEHKFFGYQVEYKKAGDLHWHELFFNRGDRFKIKGLKPSTVYVVKAATRNMVGLSPYSVQIMPKTLANSPQAEETVQTASTTSGVQQRAQRCFHLLPIASVLMMALTSRIILW